MPEFPFVSGGVVRTVGAVAGASSVATTVTASASANTKGAVVELVAATEFNANWMLVQLTNASTGAVFFLIDIMIGAATEQVIVPNLFAATRTGVGGSDSYLIPIFVPKGSRLSARCQSNSISATIAVSLVLMSGTMLGGGQSPSFVSAYGADTAATLGTNVDPGGVANTDSSWVQLTASTDRAHHWLIVAGRFGDANITTGAAWRLSIGIGAATETVLIADLHVSAGTNEDLPYGAVAQLPCFVPAGSRLTARVRCTNITDSDRDTHLIVYGAG